MSTATRTPPAGAVSRSHVDFATEERTVYAGARPVTFGEFLSLFGENDEVELISGVVVKRMAAQLDHESLSIWLVTVLNYVARRRRLGVILGSRVAVRVGEHGARLPDLLFVREERSDILQPRAVEGAPDMVMELASPGDRPSDLVALEADYRALGVPEIVFVDRTRQRLRVLRRGSDGQYVEEEPGVGEFLDFTSLPGVRIAVAHLLGENRPEPFEVIEALLATSGDEPAV